MLDMNKHCVVIFARDKEREFIDIDTWTPCSGQCVPSWWCRSWRQTRFPGRESAGLWWAWPRWGSCRSGRWCRCTWWQQCYRRRGTSWIHPETFGSTLILGYLFILVKWFRKESLLTRKNSTLALIVNTGYEYVFWTSVNISFLLIHTVFNEVKVAVPTPSLVAHVLKKGFS